MPRRRRNLNLPTPTIPSRVAGNIPRSRQNDFFQFDKIPNGIISKCDSLEVTNLRTPLFVHINVFGGHHDDSLIVLKTHVILLLGDDEENELVTEDDLSFLVDEFCS